MKLRRAAPIPDNRRAGAATRGAGGLLVLLLAGLPADAAIAGPCAMPPGSVEAAVHHVIDGDTLILADRGRVRAIGIDTPEIGREGRPDQAGAVRARRLLRGLLGEAGRIRLVTDVQQQDQYHRRLAHWFLPDGRSIQARLLHAGAGAPLTIPPNLRMLDCYLGAAESAMQGGRGLWASPQYALRTPDSLKPDARGYHRLRARLRRIHRGQKALWLQLDPQLTVRIDKSDLPWFPDLDPDRQLGRAVTVRGWLRPARGGRLQIRLRHPSDLHWQ